MNLFNIFKKKTKMKTYQEHFHHMTEEYIHGRVNAFDSGSCFCGNLEGGSNRWVSAKAYAGEASKWNSVRNNFLYKDLHYTPEQYIKMENAFMGPVIMYLNRHGIYNHQQEWIETYNEMNTSLDEYENALYVGFVKALAILKQIHIDRGENVDELVFEKKHKNVTV